MSVSGAPVVSGVVSAACAAQEASTGALWACEGRAARVSAYVSEALTQREQDDSLASLVAEWMAEDGSPVAADYAWADAVLGLPSGETAP